MVTPYTMQAVGFFFMKIIADCHANVRFSTTAATAPGNTAFKVSDNTLNLSNSS